MMNHVVGFLILSFLSMNFGSNLVRFFVWFGVQQACMKSPLGQNARFCAIYFGLSASDVGLHKLNKFASYYWWVLWTELALHMRLLPLQRVSLQ